MKEIYINKTSEPLHLFGLCNITTNHIITYRITSIIAFIVGTIPFEITYKYFLILIYTQKIDTQNK